jgi:hypothetical protein
MGDAGGTPEGTDERRTTSEIRLRLAHDIVALEDTLNVKPSERPFVLATAVIHALEMQVSASEVMVRSAGHEGIEARVGDLIEKSCAFDGVRDVGWELLVGGWLRLPGEVYALARTPVEEQGGNKKGLSVHQTGAFFTPRPLVDELVAKTFQRIAKQSNRDLYERPEDFKLVEPAVGGGFFLIGWLVEALKKFEGPTGKAASTSVSPEARRWLRAFVGDGIVAVDVDAASIELVARVVTLLQRCAGVSASECVSPTLIVGDSLEPRVSKELRGARVVIGNPPWLSYSGRQSHRKDSKVEELCERHEELTRWPSSHGAFLLEAVKSWLSEDDDSVLALLLPATVAHLDGFEPVRALLRQKLDVREPLTSYAEDAFDGVVQESMAFVAVRTIERERSEEQQLGGQPFELSAEPSAKARAASAGGSVSGKLPSLPSRVLERLDAAPRPPQGLFGDIGVHTGNVAKKLIHHQPITGGVPVLEGKDVHPYHHDEPRRWLDLGYQPEESEYFRIASADRFRSAKVLIRQTANRIIACGNPEGHYFRNSVLACFPSEDTPVDWILAWLNHEWISVYHQARVYESGQRSFPQVKVSHLRSLPMPDWSIMRREIGTSAASRGGLAKRVERGLME